MSASQDRVQSILESVLEESLPLVHKGVFTAEELQSAMCQRQKMQNNMLKPTYKLSDYLKAIQFEYNLQRIRRSKVETLSKTNPLFKKQTKTDFIIIRRIIKIWDRTMHKFKYHVELWKQYLDFCIKAQAKNHFYRVLSSALRFLPFCEDLWLIGVHYEVEIGLNYWKARKIFIKCLKMNPTKPRLWLQMFKFQIRFLSVLYQRQQAIEGQQSLNFIMHNQNEEHEHEHEASQHEKQEQKDIQNEVKKLNDIKLEEHDDILLIVYEEAMSKIQEKAQVEFRNQVVQVLKAAISSERIKDVVAVLKRALKRIQESKLGATSVPLKKEQKRLKNQLLQSSTIEQKQQYYQQYVTDNPNLPVAELDKILNQFLTKPTLFTKLLQHMLQINPQHHLLYFTLTKHHKPQNFPAQALDTILSYISLNLEHAPYLALYKKIIANMDPNKYVQCLGLMERVIRINKRIRNFKGNNDVFRSVGVLCKKAPEVLERCLTWIQQKEEE